MQSYSIIEDYVKNPSQGNVNLHLYWYFDRTTDDMTVFYRSLMRQLLEGANVNGYIPKQVDDRLKISRYTVWRTEVKRWLSSFKSLKRHIYIVLDGLDELPRGQSQQPNRHQVLEFISTLADDKYSNVHVLLSSNNDYDIREGLRIDDLKLIKEMDIEVQLREELDEFINTVMSEGVLLERFDERFWRDIGRRLKSIDER